MRTDNEAGAVATASRPNNTANKRIALTQCQNTPDELKVAKRWLLWKSVRKRGQKKPNKIPFYANGEMRNGTLDTEEDYSKLVTFDEAYAAAIKRRCGVGFALGLDEDGKYWQGIDLDGLSDHPELEALVPDLPGYVERSPSGDGVHAIGKGKQFKSAGSNRTGVECYCEGRYFTVTGDVVRSGDLVDLSECVEGVLRPLHSPSRFPAEKPTTKESNFKELRSALMAIPADCNYGIWRDCLLALHHEANGSEEGRLFAHEWSAQDSAQYNKNAKSIIDGIWRDDRVVPESERITAGTIYYHAKQYGWAPPNPTSFNPTDKGNKERLYHHQGKTIRYARERKDWIVWNGRRWQHDSIQPHIEEAHNLIQAEADQEHDEKRQKKLRQWGMASESRARIEATEKLASKDPRFRISVTDLDADPMLLGVENGAVDLRTGELRVVEYDDFITKHCPVVYTPGAKAPRWHKFLKRITGSDPGMMAFLQRAVGYSLTGRTDEQCILIPYGFGANGKSVFLSTIKNLLGPYAKQTPPETLMAKRQGAPTNDIAALQGARFVTAVESETNHRLAESLVKQMTGGDAMAARFLYGEFFEYEPQFKLWLATNHKPIIRGVDEAIWRRIKLIPFAVTIPEGDRDPKLVEKLKIELPGILNWAIEGCTAWLKEGLSPPDEVVEATNAYRAESDLLGFFLEECCEEKRGAFVPTNKLYGKYQRWCEGAGVAAMSKIGFGRRLAERGFESGKGTNKLGKRARGWCGLKLINPEEGMKMRATGVDDWRTDADR